MQSSTKTGSNNYVPLGNLVHQIEWKRYSIISLYVFLPVILLLAISISKSPASISKINSEVQNFTSVTRKWDFIDVEQEGIVDQDILNKPPGNRSPQEVSQGIYAKDTSLCSGPASQMTSEERTAICLFGSTQDFELTGPSIARWLLSRWGYGHADVFVITSLDENSHKLTALMDSRLVSVQIFNEYNLNSTKYPKENLDAMPSVKEFLKMLQMEERCIQAIQKREISQKFTYHWIVRARLDGYWVWSPPSLYHFNQTQFAVPKSYAKDDVLNDRLSVASRENTFLSLSRFQHLGDVSLKSGPAGQFLLKEILQRKNVETSVIEFYFCTLTHSNTVDTYFMGSMSPMGGLECKPCNETIPHWSGRLKCVNQGKWEEDWMTVYEKDTPPDEKEAMKRIQQRSLHQCVQEVMRMQEKTIKEAVCDYEFMRPEGEWDAPSPSAICTRSALGVKANVGSIKGKRNGYYTFIFTLNPKSIVISMSVGNEVDRWEANLKKHRGVEVQKLASPGGLDQTSDSKQTKYKKLEEMKHSWEWTPLNASQKTDVLLLDIGILVETVIDRWTSEAGSEVDFDPVCQLLIDFSYLNNNDGDSNWNQILDKLAQLDYQLDSCQGEDFEVKGRCTFFSPKFCASLIS